MAITEARPQRGRAAEPDAYSSAGLTLRAAFGIFLGTFSARFLALAFDCWLL